MKLAQIEPKAQENQETVWNEINQENLKKKNKLFVMPAREGHSKIVNLAQTTMKIMTTTNTRKGPSLPSLPNDRIGSRVKRFRFALILLHFLKLYCKIPVWTWPDELVSHFTFCGMFQSVFRSVLCFFMTKKNKIWTNRNRNKKI